MHAVRGAGFRHSAFTFGAESSVAKSNINGAKIPPGQLINFVQKGIMYSELERSVADDGAEHASSEPFSLRRPNELSDGKADGGTASDAPPAKKQNTGGAASGSDGPSGATANGAASSQQQSASEPAQTPEDQVTTLAGHTSEVFICAWSPTSLLLASGSGDSTARIWRVPEGPCGHSQANQMAEPAVLQHFSSDKEKSKDVTTLDWNHNGSALATGSYDGQARIWSAAGKLTNTLARHKGPIFSLKWNSTGSYLLSGSVDKTAIIWDAHTGDVKQQVPRNPAERSTAQPVVYARARRAPPSCRVLTAISPPSLRRADVLPPRAPPRSVCLPQGADARRRLARRGLVCELLDGPHHLRLQAQPTQLPDVLHGPLRRGQRHQMGSVGAAARVVLRRLHGESVVDEQQHVHARLAQAHEGDLHHQVEPDRAGQQQPQRRSRARQRLLRLDGPNMGSAHRQLQTRPR
jgi:hypothetical protein